jgi:hypothetical protein
MPMLDEEPTDWRTACLSPENLQVRTAARISRGGFSKGEVKPFATEKGRRGGPPHTLMQLIFLI